jgi:hypothetical protein
MSPKTTPRVAMAAARVTGFATEVAGEGSGEPFGEASMGSLGRIGRAGWGSIPPIPSGLAFLSHLQTTLF